MHEEDNKKTFNIDEVKKEIDKLLEEYRAKKDDLALTEDDWAIDEINVELDQYAKKIKVLQAKVHKYEHDKA